MPTFLNTGVLGQQAGRTLGTAGLREGFRGFRDKVLAGKKTSSRKKRRFQARKDEAESVRSIRKKTLEASKETTGLKDGILTGDVKNPNLMGDTASTQAITKALGITQQGKQATKTNVAPEFNYSAEQGDFVRSLSAFQDNIGARNASGGINRGRGDVQSGLQAVLDRATATGDRRYIDAVTGIKGILGHNDISALNVGEAKASTLAAMAKVRESLDIERIMKDLGPGKANQAPKSAGQKPMDLAARLAKLGIRRTGTANFGGG